MPNSLKARWQDWLEEHSTAERTVTFIKSWFPPLNYITIHYAYFVGVIMFSSLIFWASSSPFGSVHYVDSLFQVTSALTNTGLNTRNLSELTTWQQIQLWFLLMIGSPIWVSFWTVMVRKRAFEKRFDSIVEAERERRKRQREIRKRAAGLRRAPTLRNMLSLGKYGSRTRVHQLDVPDLGHPGLPQPHGLAVMEPLQTIPSIVEERVDQQGNPTDAQKPVLRPAGSREHISFVEPVSHHSVAKDEGHTSAYQHHNHLAPFPSGRRGSDTTTAASAESEDFLMHWKRFLGKHNVSRSGQFYDLTSDEREHLGGCEYRALKILSLAVPLYSALWQFFGAVALACYIATRTPEIPRSYDQNPWWTGIFYSVSAFNNGGFTLVDDSVISFQGDYFVLLVIGLLILAGNTAYPIFLRFWLWAILKILQLTTDEATLGPWKETLEFILKYPRRVYTTLFPARATWWLLGVLVATNVVDWLAFEILNIGNPHVHELPIGHQVMAGLFQAISVRAAGFVVISMPVLYIGVQVLYLVMMYISVYPVVITMRNSNVYEERSLGIYDDDDPAIKEQEQASNPFLAAVSQEEPKPRSLRRRNTAQVVGRQLKRAATFQGVGVRRQEEEEGSSVSFIEQQIRGQLAHDLWWLVLAILVVVVIETDHFLGDPVTFSIFNVLFESVSAYACVGLSIGLPNDSFSFSGGLHRGSKVVMCFVMLRGRHRGLPVAIDRAVRLPGEQLYKEEAEDAKIRRTKTMQRLMSRDG